MDSQRNDFQKLIEPQFAFLKTEEIADTSVLANAFEILQPQREKLNGFADSVYDLLVVPRFNIVAAQFGNRAKHQMFGNDAVLLIEPAEEMPGDAKFRLSWQLFLPEESFTFSFNTESPQAKQIIPLRTGLDLRFHHSIKLSIANGLNPP